MSGLLNRKTQHTLPLRSSSIFTEIKGFTSRTTGILTYYNDHRKEIEGLFILPLDHASAIVEFESIIEGHYIFSEVRQVAELIQKQSLYETETLHDSIFNVSIGKIPPWTLVEIQVTIICEIEATLQGEALRYVLPQTFSPNIVSKHDEYCVKSLKAVSTLPYTFQLEILIEAPCLLCGVQSNTHPIQVDAPPLSQTGAKLRISLPEEFEPISSVFELLMFLCRPREPYILIEEPKAIEATQDKNPITNLMNNPILMLSYSPDISVFHKELTENATNQVAEFILIVEPFFNQHTASHIYESCLLFLQCLPSNCFFNLISVNTTCEQLFVTSQPYSKQNLEKAFKYVRSIKGTVDALSLTKCLKSLYNQETLHLMPRQVFIVTTGNINTSDNIVELVRKNRHVSRIFTFCFGGKVNVRLFDTISAITNGKCFLIGAEERPHKQIINCLKMALKPAVTNLKVSWILPDAYDVIYTPENLPCLFLGDRMNLYAILACKETPTADKQQQDSTSSIKEFWFEDFELFEDYPSKQCSNHDLLTQDASENNSPLPTKQAATSNTNQSFDNDNEVFLTEEEANQLKYSMGLQKRSSLERIQTWRVSRHPDNDMNSELTDEQEQLTDTERKYTKHFSLRRKKSSNDGAESSTSTNSYGSNFSSSSHLLAFPGYPTRLSSCRSAEDRSPHVPKYSDDQIHFTFTDQVKDRHHSNELPHSSDSKTAEKKRRRKITQALIDEHSNTHSIDQSNEEILEKILESIVLEKRQELLAWVQLEEEMTQCSWSCANTADKTGECQDNRLEHRDSGLGQRSSSEPRTSDFEEEMPVTLKRSGQFSKSSSGYFEQENESNQSKPLLDEIKKDDAYRARLPKAEDSYVTPGETGCKKDDLKRTNSASKHHKKRIKPRHVWNTLVDKVKTITNAVTDRSGEANFKVRRDVKIPEYFHPFPNNHLADTNTGDVSNTYTQERLSQRETEHNIQSHQKKTQGSTYEETVEQKKKHVTLDSTTKTTQNVRKPSGAKNRPLIENSRTISTTSMFEIGETEIGDVDNLHLLPNHALIYLSGQFGQRAFKRIIPFQLVIGESGNTLPGDTTVHQLAAKSIIRDLEIQMDQDETLLLDSGRSYVKNLISDVSRSAHIVSKYTAVVTIDDKADGKEIIGILQHKNAKNSTHLQLAERPFVINENVKSSEFLNTTQTKPLYEITTEKPTVDSSVWHTKLTLKSPTFEKATVLGAKTHNQRQNLKQERCVYMKVVEQMTSEGYWHLSYPLAESLTLNYSHLRESCPFADPFLNNKANTFPSDTLQYQANEIYEHVWATTIALAWLHCHCSEHQEEWCLIENKARQWLQKQKLPKGFTLDDMFILSQQTLKILKNTPKRGSFTSIVSY